MDGHRSLRVYQLAYDLAMEIFHASRTFPADERYSLTDQIRRSSRSIAANIAEGYRKRQYTKMFVSKLADADGECAETQVWLDIAFDCNYISRETYEGIIVRYRNLGAMIGKMIREPEKFLPQGN